VITNTTNCADDSKSITIATSKLYGNFRKLDQFRVLVVMLPLSGEPNPEHITGLTLGVEGGSRTPRSPLVAIARVSILRTAEPLARLVLSDLHPRGEVHRVVLVNHRGHSKISLCHIVYGITLPYCYKKSRGLQLIRFVPFADIDMDVPTHVKVINHSITIVMVARHHDILDLIQELSSITIKVVVDVIVVDLDMRPFIMFRTIMVVIVDFDEVNRTRLDVALKRRVVIHTKGSLDAILLKDRLSESNDALLIFLRHISHDVFSFERVAT
jgi:hypothetical protein